MTQQSGLPEPPPVGTRALPEGTYAGSCVFVTGGGTGLGKAIAAEFPKVPHRYCQNHFLRDLAKPVLDKDSHAKVQMRRKVRGLRDIEKQVLDDRRAAQDSSQASAAAPTGNRE